MSGWPLPRIGTPRDPSRPTLGGVWTEMMRGLGFEPHGWQQHRADIQYELEPCKHGMRLAARVSATLVGRQSGKTASSGADILLRALAPSWPEVIDLVGHSIGAQHIAFTAQDRMAAKQQWENHVALILESEFAEFVKGGKPRLTNGQECLTFTNGSTYRIVTPSKGGARGLSLDLAVIDEALQHQSWLLDVIAPTQAQRDGAKASFGAQLMIISNAGDEKAELLNQQRELGRRAVLEGDRRRVWLEWSCDDADDPLDPAVWARTLPTLDQDDGIESTYLEMQAETLGTDDFAREYLCKTVWSQSRRVIPPEAWAELPYVPAGDASLVAVEVDMDRAGATIVAAEVVADLVGVRVVEQRVGVDWVAGFIAGLGPSLVVVDQGGPAASLIPSLKQVANVHKASSRDVADAAATLVDAVAARRVGHSGDPRFQDAVAFLHRRQHGNRWQFDRSHGDVSEIVAASLALWAIDTVPSESAAIY